MSQHQVLHKLLKSYFDQKVLLKTKSLSQHLYLVKVIFQTKRLKVCQAIGTVEKSNNIKRADEAKPPINR
jgi:hypothetical protein